MAKAPKTNPRETKLARVVIEAEFEVDSVELSDVLDDIRAAVEQLQCNGGYVTKAEVSLPATKMDLA